MSCGTEEDLTVKFSAQWKIYQRPCSTWTHKHHIQSECVPSILWELQNSVVQSPLQLLVGSASNFTAHTSLSIDKLSCLIVFCIAGAIVIMASPEGTITTGQGQSITLQCSLQGSQAGDNIQYQWTKDSTDIPSGVQTNGGKSRK